MASRERTSGSRAESWLLPGMDDEGIESSPEEDGSGNGDLTDGASQWLVRTAPESTEREPEDDVEQWEEVDDDVDEEELVEPVRSPREGWSGARLRKAKQKLSAQEKLIKELRATEADLNARVAELKGRVAELEDAAAEAVEQSRRPKTSRKKAEGGKRTAKPKRAKESTAPSPAAAAKPRSSRRDNKSAATLDVNSATFEEFRDLGLTITQSARLIAYRNTRDGFRSLDELAEVPGFPRETLKTLRAQVHVSTD
jgi:DNA uptake protein ComE-like DNA-binding protein